MSAMPDDNERDLRRVIYFVLMVLAALAALTFMIPRHL